jgi:hypothetical protein
MPMTAHQTIRFYDPSIDGEAVRISGFDGRGGEFWCKRALPVSAKARRAQKEEALELIEQAIEAGLEPGEVIAG